MKPYERMQIVMQNIDSLLESGVISEKEYVILSFRNGAVSHTLEETGREYGVTRERIRQIESSVIERYEANR